MQRLAVVYNLKRSSDEFNYEFASEEQIADVLHALAGKYELGAFEAPPLTMGWVHELEHFAPDLVFNLAEGYRSAAREAFYPALYEQLGLLYTGSDPTAMLVTHNKQLTKAIVQARGVRCVKSLILSPTLTAQYGCAHKDGDGCILEQHLPAVIKPNTEGSSMGINARSVVYTHTQLADALDYVTSTFSSLAIFEKYIPRGTDLSVSYVEGSSETGIWDPVHYAYDESDLLDGETKNRRRARSILNANAPITESQRASIREAMRQAVDALGPRGYARADFRIAQDGVPYFLEMNCMPVFAMQRSDFLNPLFAAGWTFQNIVQLVADQAYAKGKRLPSPGGFTSSG